MGVDIKSFLKEMLGPLNEYTPIPFWFINDTLSKDKLKEQLVDFKEKGVDGVVIHPRIGIPKDMVYLSDEYFSIIKYIVKTASELDMKIVLYDEAMYPSGSAHGEVVKANKNYASIGITISSDKENGIIIDGPKDGKYIIQKPCNGTIRGIHYGEDDGEERAPLSADILNPMAVEKFIELTHEKYYFHLKEHFGNTIIGFFTDEPCVLGRNVENFFEWTEGLLEELVDKGGQAHELWDLFEGKDNRTTILYKELLKNRLNEVYYNKLSKWCEMHGIALMGHPAGSADIEEETYFHIPGQDLVFRWVSPELGGTKGVHSVMAKCSSDAARHLGRRRNSNECFGVCVKEQIPWYFTSDDMKWFIDWLGVRGVNLFIPHAFYYSLRDQRKEERPPDVGPGNIWWKHYKYFSDYMKRVSFLMTDSTNNAKVAVLCNSGQMPVNEVEEFYQNQIEFNYLPISMLERCKEVDGKLLISGYEYDYVYGTKELLPNTKHIKGINDVVHRDLITRSFCKDLRVTHLIKQGIDMYFLVNEGTDTIKEYMTIPMECNLLSMDLWTGEYYQIPVKRKGDRTEFHLTLARRESILLLCMEESLEEFKTQPKRNRIDLTKNARLVKVDENEYKKTYVVSYIASNLSGNEVFAVNAEEMVECYCNGIYAGVSFWNKHYFACGDLLYEGENEIKFIVTGNIANKYTNVEIPYGIFLENEPRNLMSPPASQTDTSIALLWDKPTEHINVVEYQIYINNKYHGSCECTDYTLSDLAPSKEYEIYVQSKLNDGSFSLKSNTIKVRTKPTPKVYDITEFGAIGDGKTLNTQAIQNAIDACEVDGEVFVPKGIFLTGAIFLKSNMTLHIDEGGVLLGSTDPNDYKVMQYRFEGREIPCYASLINTIGYENKRFEHITICGRGKIDASGVELRKNEMIHKAGERGRAICLQNVDYVYLKDITVRQSPAWCVHMIYCNHISLNQVKIYTKFDEIGNAYGICNGDGFDPDSCSEVYVFHSFIESRDDCIAIKSGRDEEGRKVGIPSENIRITNCRFNHGFGVAIGSEMSGGVRNVFVQDCVFTDSFSVSSIKAPRGRGSIVENIRYEDITFVNDSLEHIDCKWFRGAIYIDQFYSHDIFALNEEREKNEGTAIIRDIVFKNITLKTVGGNAIYLTGLPESPLKNIYLENIKAEGKYGLKANNIEGLMLKNVSVISKEGNEYQYTNVGFIDDERSVNTKDDTDKVMKL